MNDYFKKGCCLIVFNADEKIAAHLISITTEINCTKHFYFDKEIKIADEENVISIQNYLLHDDVIETQIKNAFENAFAQGFRKVVLIKNYFDQLQVQQIAEAFNCLKMIEFCIGPTVDGGYYLLGMNYFEPSVFENKTVNSPTLLKETIKDIGKLKLAIYKLKTLN